MLAHETLETKQPEGKPSLRVMEGKAGARSTSPINSAEAEELAKCSLGSLSALLKSVAMNSS